MSACLLSSIRPSDLPRFIIGPTIVRIVVDEAHNAFLSDNYRPSMQALRFLQLAGVPKIFLTATLLPEHEPVLANCLGVPSGGRTLVLRSPTARANHSIQVASVDDSSQDIFDIGVQLVRLLIASWEHEPSVRGVVFVKSMRDLESFKRSADFPTCSYYGRMPEDEKEQQLHMWLSDSSGSTPKWIIATTALLHGVDYPRVDAVIFLGSPYGLYDYVQGAGRAGRSGQRSLIAIIHTSSFQMHSGDNKYGCQEGVEKMLTSSTCRRATVSKFMDGHATTCATLSGSELCDICNGCLDPIVQQAINAKPIATSTPINAPMLVDTSMSIDTAMTINSSMAVDVSGQRTLPKSPGTCPSNPGHDSPLVTAVPTHSLNFPSRSPPATSPTALFSGKAAQASYKSRLEHARHTKDLISKLSGCFACRISNPKHDACHERCGKSGATSCSVSPHLPFSCTSFPHKTGWIEFRKALPWKKLGYRCYFCGLPGSVITSGEHFSNVPNGKKCLYCDSAFLAAWHVLKTPQLLEALGHDLGFVPNPNADITQSFSEWLVDYGSPTEDIRLLAVFCWLCRRLYPTISG